MTKKKVRTTEPAVLVVAKLPDVCRCGEKTPDFVRTLDAISATTDYSCVCDRRYHRR